MALAWVMKNSIPIPGTRSAQHLNENIDAVDISLSPEVLQKIDRALARCSVAGARYPQDFMNAYGLNK